MSNKEFRVRPVIRHAVTEYQPAQVSACARFGQAAQSSLIGEFQNEEQAEKVARALAQQAAPMTYLLVEESPIAEFPLVRYAYNREEAVDWQRHLADKYGIGMKIFTRPTPEFAGHSDEPPPPGVEPIHVAPKTMDECKAERESQIAVYFADLSVGVSPWSASGKSMGQTGA